ncbi:hypothetical protein A5656_27535 [Mycobacterium gordonae]|nr:hypothetical protein [Mycobacterium gordonae]OBK50100.1 hypothetical protein A5656_27535 [Mycobacterium gordonae]
MTVPPDWALAIPTPGIHNAPAQIGGPLGPPIPLQQLGATMQFFIDVFVGKIAIAFGGIEILGWHPFQFLADWGQARIDQANANYLLAATADGKAQDALDFIASMVDGILGTGHTVGDFVDWLQDTNANATTSIAQWNSIIAGLAVGDFSGLLAFFEGIPTSIADAAADGAAALDKLIHVSVAGIYDAAAGFGNLATSLLKNLTPTGGNIGQFDASGLTGAFNGAVTLGGNSFTTLLQYLNSSGQFAAGQLTGAINGGLTLGGVTLSTLVTNINSSGQILAAGITGALGTGLTVGGVTLSTLFTNINSAGQLLGPGITGAINTAATVGGQAIGTIQANAQGVINGINNAAAGILSGGSTLLADAATNINLLFGGAPQYLQGLGSGVFGQTQTNDAYAAAAAAQAAQAAEQARITSAFNAVFNVSPTTSGNVSIAVDFSGMANAANMSGVMSPGNTSMGITSGAAALQGPPYSTTFPGAAEAFPTQTVSDYQAITATLGPLNDLNTTFITGRCNSARDTYVAVELSSSATSPPFRVRLTAFVAGTRTILATTDVANPSLGASLRLILGDPSSSSPYAMQVLLQGTPIITYTDSSHVSQLGASYRYVGLVVRQLDSTHRGVDIRSVTYQDNPPASASYPFSGTPAAGTKGRMYVSNDVGLIQRDNGSAWEYIWGGPLGYLTKPPSSSWSWVNQGGASTATELGGERITAPSSTRNFRLRTRTLSPSSNYSAAAYVEAAGVPVSGSNLWLGGIGLRNSSSGSFISFGPYLDNTTFFSALAVYRWTNATTISANSFAKPVYQLAGGVIPNWLRIRDDGSNRYFDYSTNGVDWINVHSEGRTAFITPDQFCFGLDNEGSGADAIIRLRSLSGIS